MSFVKSLLLSLLLLGGVQNGLAESARDPFGIPAVEPVARKAVEPVGETGGKDASVPSAIGPSATEPTATGLLAKGPTDIKPGEPDGKMITNSSGETDDEADASSESGNPFWIGIWTGYSPVSNSFLAKMEKTRFAMGGIEWVYGTLNNRGGTPVELSGELILLGWTGFPKNGRSGPRESRFGIGAVPIRLSLPLTAMPRNHYPYLSLGAGFFFFDNPFPTDDGTNLNATVDLGIGYTFRIDPSTRLNIGYRFHHLSNGGSGLINPGLDSNMFVISIRSRIL